MSVPVTYANVLSVQAAVQAIATSGGYFNTVKSTSVVVDPEDLSLVNVMDVPYVIVGGYQPGARDFTGSKPTSVKDRFTLMLVWRIDVPGLNPSRLAKEAAAWNFVADLEVALAKDLQRGGAAMYTYVQQPTIWLGAKGVTAVYGETPVEILLQRTYGKP